MASETGIRAAHVLLYTTNADADRTFLSTVMQIPFVDAGHGWLIFKLPPSELAIHPTDGEQGEGGGGPARGELYLMCQDLTATMAALTERGVACGPVTRERWGVRTSIALPSGSSIGLYEPTHPTAFNLTE